MTGIYGQDWSGYQSSTQSPKDIDFVFLKVTEGLSYENTRWKSQYETAKNAGLVIGFYHYPHMSNSPKEEADYFLSKVTPKPGEMVVLDWEGYDVANRNVSDSVQRAYKEAFLTYIKSKLPNNPVGMYCNTDYWKNVDKTSNYGDFLWIATANRPAGDPGILSTWLFHQYSTAGGIDRDYCTFKDRASLKAWVLSFAQTNSEENMTVAAADLKAIAKEVLTIDNILDAPKDSANYATNKFWSLETYIQDTNSKIRALTAQVTALQAAVANVSTPVVDVQALADAVVTALGKELTN